MPTFHHDFHGNTCARAFLCLKTTADALQGRVLCPPAPRMAHTFFISTRI